MLAKKKKKKSPVTYVQPLLKIVISQALCGYCQGHRNLLKLSETDTGSLFCQVRRRDKQGIN